MALNSDNLLPQLLQDALSRAYPTPLPSNQIIFDIESPQDPVDLGDDLTASVAGRTSLLWGADIDFGGQTDWSGATLTNCTAANGVVVLTSGQTSGTATTSTVDLTLAGAAPGSSLTVYVRDLAAYSDTSNAYQIRFSPDGTTWGAYQALASGQTFPSIERYCQIEAALVGTASLSPQVSGYHLAVATPSLWGGGQWAGTIPAAFVTVNLPVMLRRAA